MWLCITNNNETMKKMEIKFNLNENIEWLCVQL